MSEQEIIETVIRVFLPLGDNPGETEMLATVKSFIEQILNPRTITRPDRISPSNPEGYVTVRMDFATARAEMKVLLDGLDYLPELGKQGTIEDLRSDQRLNLLLETAVGLARGYGAWKQATGEGEVDAYPCFEFYRAGQRKEPRDWPSRWTEAGGEFYQGGRREPDYPDGRMIARKDDPIWPEISAFGLPYPPFDFNSGMSLLEISWAEAVDLGVIEEDVQVRLAEEEP